MKNFFLITLAILPCILYAQRKPPVHPSNQGPPVIVYEGYYFKDGVRHDSVYLYATHLAEWYQKVHALDMEYSNPVVLIPSEVSEFTRADGKKFVSREVLYAARQSYYFLEELLNYGDSVRLFHLKLDSNPYAVRKPTFFVERKGEVSWLLPDDNPEGIWQIMKAHSDCGDNFKILPRTATPERIKRYEKALAECNYKFFQRHEFGVTSFIGTKYNTLSKDYTFMPEVGFYGKIPLDEGFSFRPELLFAYHTDEDMGVLQLPLMFRYCANQIRGKVVPYVETGIVGDIRLKKAIDNDKAWLLMPGFSAGTGIEWRVTYKRTVNFGFRWIATTMTYKKENYHYMGLNLAVNIF